MVTIHIRVFVCESVFSCEYLALQEKLSPSISKHYSLCVCVCGGGGACVCVCVCVVI